VRTHHVVSGALGAVETAVCSHVPGNLSGLQEYVCKIGIYFLIIPFLNLIIPFSN
jgi:hypothetical protein